MDLDEYFTMQSRQNRFRGTVLVMQEGRTLFNGGYGDADREAGRPNTPETAFQIASVSKQFAAAAILLLQERGALSVRDHVCKWLPDCPKEWEAITLHHLLTHTSGIGHWFDLPELSLDKPNTRENLLRIFQHLPLKFSPGTGWAYSSPGYVLLAHIVEQASGEPYAACLQRMIFGPLGMTSTSAGNRVPLQEQQATGYAGKNSAPSFELDTVSIGAGDIWATARDLALWDAALAAPGLLLSTQSLHAMFFPHAAAADGFSEAPGAHYGYGWCIAEVAGHVMHFHPGDNSGFGSLNLRLPDDDVVVVLLSNDEDNDLWKISRHLVNELLDNPGGTL